MNKNLEDKSGRDTWTNFDERQLQNSSKNKDSKDWFQKSEF